MMLGHFGHTGQEGHDAKHISHGVLLNAGPVI